VNPVLTEAVKTKFAALDPWFDERLRRRWAAVEARQMGRGGIACVAAATGLSRTTIHTGLKELDANETAGARPDTARLRRPGAGRKPLTAGDPKLARALERLVDPVTRGDPMGPLLWTCSSAARLAAELTAAGHPVSERTVNRLLHELGYSLQANRQTLDGAQHAARDYLRQATSAGPLRKLQYRHAQAHLPSGAGQSLWPAHAGHRRHPCQLRAAARCLEIAAGP